MCEFCSEHGDGKVWFKNAENYGKDLLSDLARRDYINRFFTSTIEEGAVTIGRLETLYGRKKRLPARLVQGMVDSVSPKTVSVSAPWPWMWRPCSGAR